MKYLKDTNIPQPSINPLDLYKSFITRNIIYQNILEYS